MKIAIIGCGIIGMAMKKWLEKNNKDVYIFVSDPAKGFYDDVYHLDIDAYFISIHVPTLSDGKQDDSVLINIIKKIPVDKPIWIRTTILPSVLKKLQFLTNDKNIRPVFYMPEFLTERTSNDDFNTQTMIFTGGELNNKYINILKKIFNKKKFIIMNSYEACIAKYAHNIFGALKVTYFNCIYEICKNMNDVDFKKVLIGILISKYINDVHTKVPGPDGKFGYGGKCFPKDVDAFKKEFKNTNFEKLIKPLKNINNNFRFLK